LGLEHSSIIPMLLSLYLRRLSFVRRGERYAELDFMPRMRQSEVAKRPSDPSPNAWEIAL
jgi:hypothetical protein